MIVSLSVLHFLISQKKNIGFPSPCMGQTGLPSSLFTRICCEKDVIAEPLFKAAGAEVDSRPCVVSAGICLVGAPLFKRLGVLLLTLRAARLPAISEKLASRISGSWVSVLLYRRCTSSVVKKFFFLAAVSDEEGVVVPLNQQVAEEITVLACLAPLAAVDISAPVQKKVYATDASLKKGAVTARRVSQHTAEIWWLDGDKKGGYTR